METSKCMEQKNKSTTTTLTNTNKINLKNGNR